LKGAFQMGVFEKRNFGWLAVFAVLVLIFAFIYSVDKKVDKLLDIDADAKKQIEEILK